MSEYKESKEDQEVMEITYRLLHTFGWSSANGCQSKNEFYYALQEAVEHYRQTGVMPSGSC